MSSHISINPAIHYWGTPVVLVTTLNADGKTCNIAPISSAWWLGKKCLLGFGPGSHTLENLLRTKQCVLNLPSDDMAPAVNALARTSGAELIPEFKQNLGYTSQPDKFRIANLTHQSSSLVAALRIQECPVQIECEFVALHKFSLASEDVPGLEAGAVEVRILKTWVREELKLVGYEDRVDPDKWRPMIMCFQHLYGLREGKVEESKLARIEEERYRLP